MLLHTLVGGHIAGALPVGFGAVLGRDTRGHKGGSTLRDGEPDVLVNPDPTAAHARVPDAAKLPVRRAGCGARRARGVVAGRANHTGADPGHVHGQAALVGGNLLAEHVQDRDVATVATVSDALPN